MTYMQNNLAFVGGIQELSFDEIGAVSGGFDDGFFESQEFGDDWETGKKKKKKDEEPSVGDQIRDAARRAAKAIPGKKDDWVLLAAAEAVGYAIDWATSDSEN